MSTPHPQGVAPHPQSALAPDASVPRTPDHLYVLKDGDSFVVADTYGDIAGSGDGFFLEDTRLLSCFYLLLGGERPTLLSSAVAVTTCFSPRMPPTDRCPHSGTNPCRRAWCTSSDDASCGTGCYARASP